MYNVFHILNYSGTHCCLWLEAFTIRNLPPMTWLPNHSFLGFFSLLSCHMEIAGQQLRSIMNHLMQLCDGTISLFPWSLSMLLVFPQSLLFPRSSRQLWFVVAGKPGSYFCYFNFFTTCSLKDDIEASPGIEIFCEFKAFVQIFWVDQYWRNFI